MSELKYYFVSNESTKEVSVGIGDNIDLFKSAGMILGLVDQSKLGKWYLDGYVPNSDKLLKEIDELKSYLCSTDWVVIKMMEYKLINKSITDYSDIINKRNNARIRINEIESII